MFCYENIKNLRKTKNLKQKDLAIVLETTQENYSLWESGKREIPLHHAITLAAFYGVTLDYLILNNPG